MEVLVIASKVKAKIKEAGLSTSANVMQRLTQIVERECNKAIENAKRSGRKTVMDRDFDE